MNAEAVLRGEPPPAPLAPQPTRPARWRRWLRRLLWAVAALFAALLLVALAWVASNWRDALSQPRPPELLAPMSQLPPADNAAWALADLRPPTDKDPAAAAAANVLLGARCTGLLDGPWQFEEVTAEPLTVTSPLAPHALGAVACSRWFRNAALLAGQQGRRDEALAQLARADRLQRSLQAGSHSLVAQVIAWRLARDTLNSVTDLVLRDASLAPALQRMLAGWPDATAAAAATRRWIAFESRFGQAAMQSLHGACAAAGRVAWGCLSQIGFQTQRTVQALDARWLALYRALDAGLPAVLQQQLAQDRLTREAGEPGLWARLSWRNPTGSLMLTVTDGAYTGYLLRQADLELSRETTAWVLAAQAQRVPAAERAVWTAKQPLSDTLRARLQWADGGRTLNVRNWQSEQPESQWQAERDAIRITWPD